MKKYKKVIKSNILISYKKRLKIYIKLKKLINNILTRNDKTTHINNGKYNIK